MWNRPMGAEDDICKTGGLGSHAFPGPNPTIVSDNVMGSAVRFENLNIFFCTYF
jgi:hypothetical protein